MRARWVTTWESGVPLTVVNGQDADSVGGNLDRPLFNRFGHPGVRAVPATATAASDPCHIFSAAAGANNTYYTNPEAGGACIERNDAQYIGLLAETGRGNL